MVNKDELINNFETEINRGSMTLAVLSQLFTKQYGYSLLQSLEEKGTSIDANTLYPLLRRLEEKELLESTWDTTEKRPRKYYLISPIGKEVFEKLKTIWFETYHKMDLLLKEENKWN